MVSEQAYSHLMCLQANVNLILQVCLVWFNVLIIHSTTHTFTLNFFFQQNLHIMSFVQKLALLCSLRCFVYAFLFEKQKRERKKKTIQAHPRPQNVSVREFYKVRGSDTHDFQESPSIQKKTLFFPIGISWIKSSINVILLNASILNILYAIFVEQSTLCFPCTLLPSRDFWRLGCVALTFSWW